VKVAQIDVKVSNRRLAATKKTTKATTIHLREDDEQILEELRQLTGLKNGQIIRSALRTLLRRIKKD
jgi:hypothetical protein